MSGIIPAELTRSGMWVCPDWRYMRPPRNRLRAYCTGTRRCASWKKTMSATSTTPRGSRAMPMPASPAEELTMLGSNVGMPATMPPKMMREMPLPMPFSVMSSPSQTRNMVPAVMETTAANVGRASLPVKPMSLMRTGAAGARAAGCSPGRTAMGTVEPVGVEGYLVAPLLALLGQGLEGRHDGDQELHDDGGGDVRVDAHGGDAQLSQGAAAEQVQEAQDGVVLEDVAEPLRRRRRGSARGPRSGIRPAGPG